MLYLRLFILFLLSGLLSLSNLTAAEIRDGQLYLEILITEGQSIKLAIKENFEIKEVYSPLAFNSSGNAILQIASDDEDIMWGIINRTEPVNEDSMKLHPEDYYRQKFIWQDGKLKLQSERVVFEDKYFQTRGGADKYAVETGYSSNDIHPIPMQNARVKVTFADGKVNFYQLPITLLCMGGIKLGNNDDVYKGIFFVKAVNGKLIVTHLQDIENYVTGVVPNEIGDSAPLEALKAQAVAARTHAVSLLLYNRHLDDEYDLCNTTHCQVYKGNHLLNEEIIRAVQETSNTVLIYEDMIADAVYHSCCGGRTESNQNAWSGKAIPYLQGVACSPETDILDLTKEANAVKWIDTNNDHDNMASWEKRSSSWTKTVSRSSLQMNSGVKNPCALAILRRGVSGRILRLKVMGNTEKVFDGEYRIRQLFGGLPSSFFYISNGNRTNTIYILSDQISVKGKGSGHGVGLCQVGALQKSRNGWKWDEILQHYYPGVCMTTDWLETDSDKTSNGVENNHADQ